MTEVDPKAKIQKLEEAQPKITAELQQAKELEAEAERERTSQGKEAARAREQEEKERWWKFGGAMLVSILGVGWLMYLVLTAPLGGPEPVLWPAMLLTGISSWPVHGDPRLLRTWAYLMGAAGGLGLLMILWGVAAWCGFLSMVGLVWAYQDERAAR